MGHFKKHEYWRHFGHHRPHGSMMGKLISFVIGVCVGVFINQRYRMPAVSNPRETWEEMKRAAEEAKERSPNAAEITEIIEKLKAMEKKYRKAPENADGQTDASSDSS